MTTITPSRPTARPGRGGFAHLLRAEWTKFRTVRGWVIAVLVAVLVAVLLGLFIGSHSHVSPCSNGPNSPCHYAAIPTGPGGEAVTDTFYFVHRPLTEDGSITTRVTSLTEVTEGAVTPQGGPAHTQPAVVPWSKAGLIITAGAGQGSAYAAVMVTGSHGTRMQWNYTGDTPGLAGGVSAASPRWLRLTRAGDVITGYDSGDGVHWIKIGTVILHGLAPAVQAGLFATSPGYMQQTSQQVTSSSGTAVPTDATAAFDRVGLHGGWPGSSWTGTSVNVSGISPYVTGHEAGYRQVADSFTVTGSGDIAPDVTDGVAIDVLLVGAVHRADPGGRRGCAVHDHRVPAGPDPRHARRQPAARPGPGRQGHRPRRRHLRRRAG